MNSPVILDGDSLDVGDVAAVAHDARPVDIAPAARRRMRASRRMVEDLLAQNAVVYGVTTGFGKFSDTAIAPDQVERLQENLIKSHACAVGEPFPVPVVRAMMLLRANALAKGHSGIRPEVVDLLVAMLNRGVHPVVPQQGSLGASGDLAPLAHVALALIGLGRCEFRGAILPSAQALKQAGLAPVRLAAKEGLALINGTQAMTALAALAVADAQRLVDSADIVAALTVEALRGIPHAYHPLLAAVRPHPGQARVAQRLRALLAGSQRTSAPGQLRVQDAYSLRCIPQVHGASRDALDYVAGVVRRELNAATDNPLLFPDAGEVISGGNFHGQPVAVACDFLAIAVAELASISERRIERCVNPALSGLPAFLTRHGGLCSGLMIPQYVAASLVSENKVLAHPASVDSIPSSANQEDHVSMGTTAARKLRQILDNTFTVLAIEYLCAAQAIEFGSGRLGAGTQAAYDLLRTRIAPLDEDRELDGDIAAARDLITSGALVRRVAEALAHTQSGNTVVEPF